MKYGLLLLLMALPGSAFGQARNDAVALPTAVALDDRAIRFDHLTEFDGLSQGCGHDIFQDSRGFLWVGTQDGLNRYDGYEFHTYYPSAFDSTSLISGWITDIDEGPGGYLWLGTDRSLTRFHPSSETFEHFTHDPEDESSLSHMTASSVLADRRGGVWIATMNGLNYMAPGAVGSFRRFRHDPNDPLSLGSNLVLSLFEDSRGRIWMGTANGLNRADPESPGRFERYLFTPGEDAHPHERPWSVVRSVAQIPGDEDVLWLGSYHGLIRLDTRTGASERFVPEGAGAEAYSFSRLVPDVEDPRLLWAGGRGGFFGFDTRTGRFTRYPHDPGDTGSLPGNVIDAVFADRSGTVWVSASCGGLSRFNTTGSRFRLVRPAQELEVPLQFMGAGAVADDGALWVGSRNAAGVTYLHRIDPESGAVLQRPLGPGFVTAVIPDRDGSVWVGHGALLRIDRSMQVIDAFRHEAEDTSSLSGEYVVSLLEDRQGRLWVGTPVGMDLFDRETGAFRRFDPEEASNPPPSITDRAVLSLFESADGTIWSGTRTALHRFDPSTESFVTYRRDPTDSSTPSGHIRAIHERSREPGVLWLAGSGLDRLDLRTGAITHYTTRDGLPNNTIYGMLEDEQGHLWLSTNRGLSRFDPAADRFLNFGVEHGLQGLEFNEKSAFKSPDGQMFFGGIRGLTSFYPDEVAQNPVPPTVVLTDLRLHNESVAVGPDGPLKRALQDADGVRLRHHQNHVAFDFVGLHFQNPSNNRYAYILEGFDPDWIEAGSRREAVYTNLPNGAYTFHVRASNSDGVWSEPLSFGLVILPPWWRTWWANFFYLIVLVGVLVLAHRMQRTHMMRRERELMFEREQRHARELERANARLEGQNERLRHSEEQLERQNRQLEHQNEQIEEQNRRLRELDEVKTRFFSNISHEFRTPLTLLLGPLNHAIRSGRSIEHEDLPLMRQSARRLLRLINQLLDLSKVEAGALRLHRESVDFGSLLRRLAAAFTPHVEGKNLRMIVEAPPDGVAVGLLDADKLEKIASNLMSNAVKFTPRGGKIRVALRVEAPPAADNALPMAVLEVEDTGRGIPHESLTHVFDRFFQVDGSTTRENEGTGIGLALTKELVELHDGRISVDSKPGFGSCFRVYIPLPQQEETATTRSESQGNRETAPHSPVVQVAERQLGGDGWDEGEETSGGEAEADAGPRAERGMILVVDDHPEMCVYIKRLLRRAGYDVELALDGERGLQRARTVRPDLVIADVMMPRMDGHALCRALKEDESLAAVPVVLLTARAAEEDRLEGIGVGADDYLTKPFSPEELLLRTENLIEIRRRLRNRYSSAVRLGPEEIAVTSADAAFVEEVREAIETRLGDSQFGVETLAEAVGMSARQLHRRIRDLTGLTPGGYIRMMRLQRAEQLLRQRAGNVSEIAYAVGFSDAKYFSRIFRQMFGSNPSSYQVTERT